MLGTAASAEPGSVSRDSPVVHAISRSLFFPGHASAGSCQ